MLSELHLKNFRGFEDHKIPFRELSVVVGANNAGKSTIVEALRLVSIVTSRYKSLKYNTPPDYLEKLGAHSGVSPSLQNLAIDFENIFHRYGDPPATIEAEFEDLSCVLLFVEEDGVFASIFGPNRVPIENQISAKRIHIPSIAVMPQIGPLQKDEEIRTEKYVIGRANSNLSSLHFRNHFLIFEDLLGKVQKSLSETWTGIQLQEISNESYINDKIRLNVRCEDFVAEVGLMGHGLQMWLQMLAFLCRSEEIHTVILDEPDVYMHADMQRRLIRHLKGRFPQAIVMTHSVEIMSEVDPDKILVIDRNRFNSKFAATTPAVQKLLSHIGSEQNLHLARLWSSRRLILVEGKDMKFIKLIQDIVFPRSKSPIGSVPNMAIGGWGGWNYAVGSSMVMDNAVGEEIVTYCLFDRDYHTDKDIENRFSESVDKGVQLHIWSKEEIENYFLIPQVIHRLIAKRTPSGNMDSVDSNLISQKIEQISDQLEDEAFDAISEEYLMKNRAKGAPAANKEARRIIRQHRDILGSIKDLVSGKTVISRLSEWSKSELNVSFGPHAILKEMIIEEVPTEFRDVIQAVESGSEFPSSLREMHCSLVNK